jgi:hypothetical protein
MGRLVKANIDSYYEMMHESWSEKNKALFNRYKDSGKYSEDQLCCIEDAIMDYGAREKIEYIANPKFSPEQMDALLDNFNYFCLDDDEAKFISDVEFSAEQMDEIGTQLGRGYIDLEDLKKIKHLKEYSAEEIEDIVFDLNHDKITIDELNDVVLVD